MSNLNAYVAAINDNTYTNNDLNQCYKCGQYYYGWTHQCDTYYNPPSTGTTWTWPTKECEHCYCGDAEDNGMHKNEVGPHKQCCKCKERMSVRFIKG